MRILSISLQNFASYEKLEFDFTNQGLTLIQGATGSGKSTLCDAIPWVLFGRTAKGGAVDEIIPWGIKDSTKGFIKIEINNIQYSVSRARNPNELWYIKDSAAIRGKDTVDTQKQINQLLGLDYDLYMAGAYYHEFSKTAAFFTASAKDRRTLCEQLVDLSLATKIKDNLTNKAKELSKRLKEAQSTADSTAKVILFLNKQNKEHEAELQTWDNKHFVKIQELENKQLNFESNKAKNLEKEKELLTVIMANTLQYAPKDTEESDLKSQLNTLQEQKCITCGAPQALDSYDTIKDRLSEIKNQKKLYASAQERIDTIMYNIAQIESSINTHGAQLEELRKESNPYRSFSTDNNHKLLEEGNNLDSINQLIAEFKEQLLDLDLLADVLNEYRTMTVKNTVNEVQEQTNQLLTNHFDAEIKVLFSVQEADKLSVDIVKDGNQCVYTQLSKGQRQLLKLCFGLSVMRIVANRHALSFNCLFLDEAFDGLDENLKIKAHSLLSTIAIDHESVFVVEHSEALKSMFSKKYTVQLINGKSQIEEA